MARIRTVKPEFWSDSKTGTLSDRATKLFIGMLNYSDDYGVLEFDVASLKARIFPYEADVPEKVVLPYLTDELLVKGLVTMFIHDGGDGARKNYLFIRNFGKHQKVDKPGKPLIDGWKRGDTPETFAADSATIPRTDPEGSDSVRCGKVREGKGEEGNGMESFPETDEVYIARVKKFYNDLEEENGTTYADWQKHYSDTINVDACLFAATTWLIENPKNRKKNLKRFYGNWLRNQYTRRTQPRT